MDRLVLSINNYDYEYEYYLLWNRIKFKIVKVLVYKNG